MEHKSVLSGDAGVVSRQAGRLRSAGQLLPRGDASGRASERIAGENRRSKCTPGESAGPGGIGLRFRFYSRRLDPDQQPRGSPGGEDFAHLYRWQPQRGGAHRRGSGYGYRCAQNRACGLLPGCAGQLETIKDWADCDCGGQSVRLSVLGDGWGGQRAWPQYARAPRGA